DVGEADITLAARNIADELEADDGERVVAWRGGHRWVPAYQKIRLEPPSGGPPVVRAGGAFLLTGGTGPLELAIAERLAAAGAKGIAFIECDGGAEAAVAGLRDRGIEVLCSPALVTRREALAGAVAAAPGYEALLEQLREMQNSVGITIDEGVEALWRALELGLPQVVVSTQDLDELVAQATSSSVAEFLEGVGRATPQQDGEGTDVS